MFNLKNKNVVIVLFIVSIFLFACSNKTKNIEQTEQITSDMMTETYEEVEYETTTQKPKDETKAILESVGVTFDLPESYMNNRDKFYLRVDNAMIENGFAMGSVYLLEVSEEEYEKMDVEARQKIFAKSECINNFVTLDDKHSEESINNFFKNSQIGLSVKLTKINEIDNITYYTAVYNMEERKGEFSDDVKSIANQIIDDMKNLKDIIIYDIPEGMNSENTEQALFAANENEMIEDNITEEISTNSEINNN